MKVLGRVNGMLWRGAEWLAVTLGISWFLIWACTRGSNCWRRGRHDQRDHLLGG